jgi:hypothetical protein
MAWSLAQEIYLGLYRAITGPEEGGRNTFEMTAISALLPAIACGWLKIDMRGIDV